MGANLPRRRAAADQNPVQRSDSGEARLWHLGTVLTVSFTVAVVGLAGLAWLAWILLGLAGYRRHGAPELHDTVGVLQLVFATVAGAGALVALIVAYRRQKIAEADSVHERTRVFNERFTAIAAQLGDDQPAVRLAGVHAMAGLADDWRQNRQTCVDVLCAYLRLPYDSDPGDDADPAERTAYRANREVRHTIIRVVTAHMRSEGAVSWQGLNLDFTGVVFDGGDFTQARFSSGVVVFSNAVFPGGWTGFRDAVFCGADVGFGSAVFSGGQVSFDNTVFSGGRVGFRGAVFSGGQVSFDNAMFSDGRVSFRDAVFSGGEVSFDRAEFSGGQVSFDRAEFSGSQVSFDRAEFSGSQVSLGDARFSGGQVRFSSAVFSGGEVSFGSVWSTSVIEYPGQQVPFDLARFHGAEFSGAQVSFDLAKFSGGQVSFADVGLWSHPPMFSWDGKPPAGVVLPVQPPEETKG